MKKITILLFLMICFFAVKAKSQSNICSSCSRNGVYIQVAQTPAYKGGMEQLYAELNNKLALSKRINGKGCLSFIVTEDGTSCCFEIVKITSKSSIIVDNETQNRVMEALKTLQNWQAGKQNNKSVNVLFNFFFSIEKGKVKTANKK